MQHHRIIKKLRRVYGDAIIRDLDVYMGCGDVRVQSQLGWWYRIGDSPPVFLGKNVFAALAAIDEIAAGGSQS